ncbi:FUSC family protein [Streptomyces sp. NPDC088354]|uniref:FUSC family protein n=1 Tax=unclassified Streptomyces TaxID=2593676 RepID=UPI0029BB5E32|nr:FUSC family protein [Streptomyces sp. MI02-7b]MDX3072726.1 FUSC family protein [Streptomyces sp. MI02-7b]
MRSIFRGIPDAAVTSAALLLAFGAALRLRGFGLDDGIVVLTVALTLTLARVQRGAALRRRLLGLAVLPVVAVATSGVGWLLFRLPAIGSTVFALGVGAAIWVRRFGPVATAAGTLATLPFVAVLVTPVAPGSGGARFLWAAVAALIAFLSVAVCQLAAARAGIVGSAAPPATPAPRPRTATGPAVSDRMACQMALALGTAFLVGRLVFPDHWSWTVLTAFIVCSGNRGRGDVVHKSVLRIVGAAAGVAVATSLAGAFAPGDPSSIAVVLAVLAVASWLRGLSYAYWAGAVTAALSLLYGYYGQTGADVLVIRLEAVVLGALAGVAASWFVLPVRSGDVARRRTADALAALTDLLSAFRGHDAAQLGAARARFDDSLLRLDEIAAPFRAHRTLSRLLRRAAPHPADALDALRACAEPVGALALLPVPPEPGLAVRAEALTANAVAVRRALGRRPGPPRRALPAPAPHGPVPAHAALDRIDDALQRLTAVHGHPPPPTARPHDRDPAHRTS